MIGVSLILSNDTVSSCETPVNVFLKFCGSDTRYVCSQYTASFLFDSLLREVREVSLK